MGILCGLFFGEMAAALNPVGRAYIRLLQMAIVPYIIVSLIAGLGRLTPQQASRIALWGGLVLLLLVPLAYPDWEAANYFSSSLVSSSASVDFVSLYISANPFESLANTVVPAIVLFSIVMGVAVMRSEKKGPLLELLVLSYVLFSGWYAGTPLPLDRYPIFATVGLFVAFGGSKIGLPFFCWTCFASRQTCSSCFWWPTLSPISSSQRYLR
jgi:hypothetical protein